MSVTIYHNPRCSKSRQTLDILNQQNVDVEIIEYLKASPDVGTLKQILSYLKIPARDLLRKGESAYKEAGLDDTSLSEDEIITAMVEHPILIERPVVVNNGKAAIGRPPESVLDIL
jgi:arsenate reductase (glutaredoxin)